ncbi:MAG: hypothetical protein ABI427_01860 [Solirubrobacteraceae bacterium]
MASSNPYPWRASANHAEPVVATEDLGPAGSALIAVDPEQPAGWPEYEAEDLIWEA